MKFIKLPNCDSLVNLDNVARIYFNEEFKDAGGYYIRIDLNVSSKCFGTERAYFKTKEEVKNYFELLDNLFRSM